MGEKSAMGRMLGVKVETRRQVMAENRNTIREV